MAQVNVSLPDDLRDWADSRAVEGGYAGTGDYLREMVSREREYQDRVARLQAAIDEGRASGVSERTIKDVIADGRRRRAPR